MTILGFCAASFGYKRDMPVEFDDKSKAAALLPGESYMVFCEISKLMAWHDMT